jgi:hypothetical protein
MTIFEFPKTKIAASRAAKRQAVRSTPDEYAAKIAQRKEEKRLTWY